MNVKLSEDIASKYAFINNFTKNASLTFTILAIVSYIAPRCYDNNI